MSEEEIVQEQTEPECKISYISERPEKFCRELEKKEKNDGMKCSVHSE